MSLNTFHINVSTESSLWGKLDPFPVVAEATSSYIHTLIMLHGRGSNAMRFAYDESEPDKLGVLVAKSSIGMTLQQHVPGLCIIFPQAPLRRCTARNRTKMNIWFDTASFDDIYMREELQIDGLCENARILRDLIRAEADVVGIDKVFLGGLSQGCAMAVYMLIDMEQEDKHLAGFIGLSGRLPFQQRINQILSKEDFVEDDNTFSFYTETDLPEHMEQGQIDGAVQVAKFMKEDVLDGKFSLQNLIAQRGTPVFLGHGECDEVVPVELGRNLKDTLRSLGFDVKWTTYSDLGHWYEIPTEIDDLIDFLQSYM